jgi:hypothetical protein
VTTTEENRDPHQAIDYIIKHARHFAKAKAQRKSLKAILMKKSGQDTVGAQEREAYAAEEYKELLVGLREATEIEEKLRWDLIAAQARVEVWRTEQANYRAEGKATI